MTVTLTTEARNLVRSNFFGKDFESYVNEIIGFIALEFGDEVASNIQASEQGIMLIEMVAFALSTASWYGDRQSDDTHLYYVRLRHAAVVIARQLGYKPRAAVAPAIEITMTLATPPTSTRLTLERGRELVGPGGLSYWLNEEVIFDVGEVGPKTFSASEGQLIEEIFTSNGEPNQWFGIETVPDGMSLAQDTPRSYVDGIEWAENPLLTYEQTNQFEVQYGFNPPRLQFGDGIAGNVPPDEAEIRLTYQATSGPAGFVQANTVTAFKDPLIAGTETLAGTLVHNETSTPGSSRETIDSIKVNAPQVTQAADRAVTQADLDGLINAFIDPTWGAVAIGRATVPRAVDQDAEALTIIALIEAGGIAADVVTRLRTYWDKVLASNYQANVVVAQILATDVVGRYVTAPVGLARALETYLDERVESTVKVAVTDGSINLYAVDLTVQVKPVSTVTGEAALEALSGSVVTALEEVLLGRSYGMSLRISDLYAIVDGLEGVDYSGIEISKINDLDPGIGQINAYGDLVIQDYEVITLGNPPAVTLL